jgi:hypothetical protein
LGDSDSSRVYPASVAGRGGLRWTESDPKAFGGLAVGVFGGLRLDRVRRMLSSRAQALGLLAGSVRSHSAAQVPKVTAPVLGSSHLPRARSARSVASWRSASLRVRKVFEYSRPVGVA